MKDAQPHAAGRTTASDIYRQAVLVPLFAGAKAHAHHYDRVDRAHALMLTECGILSRPDGARLLAALQGLAGDAGLAARRDAGPYEDLFYVREAALRELLGPDLAGRLHTGRSRNDLEATVFRLELRHRMQDAAALLGRCIGTVLSIAQDERATRILAYTHGQPAQPSTYGHYLLAFGEVLLRDLRRLVAALADVDACPLGAAAITTTGFPISRERLAELLGFAEVQENAYGCIAAADQFAAAQSALHLLFLNVGRLCQDLAFWTAFEVGQARAGDGFVQVSSIMPQKRNPLAIEHMRVMASLGAGHCQTAIGALHNTPFADMVDAEGPTQSAGLASFDMAGRLLPLLEAFLADLEIDHERVRVHTDRSCAAMTELADSLVRLEGIPFRAAHEIAAGLARSLMAAGRGLDSLQGTEVADAFQREVGRRPALGEARLRQLVDPAYFVAVRDRTGGPAQAAVQASLRRYRMQLQELLQAVESGRARGLAAQRQLDEAVGRCIA